MDRAELSDNISKLLERVRVSSEKRQFGNSEILVLAVSKTRSAAEIRTAFECGLSHFGESYVQEATDKMPMLADLDITWHFIGPIQANKTRQIAGHFDWVHGIDREKIARRLSEQRPPERAPLQVCIQVNISGEATKSGVQLHELPQLARAIAGLPRLALRGLMGIPSPTASPAQLHAAFERLREARDALRATLSGIDTLSMGMSDDLDIAIAEGATIVRPGSAIFGPRSR